MISLQQTQIKPQMKTIKVKDFLDMHKIPYTYVTHKFTGSISEKPKKTLVKKTAPPTNWHKNSYETQMALNDYKGRRGDETTLMAYLANSRFCVLDADTDEGSKYLNEHYGYNNVSWSISKNLPHMWCLKDANDPGKAKVVWKPGIDLIYGVIFEQIDGEIDYYEEDNFMIFQDYPKPPPEPIQPPPMPTRNISDNFDDTERTFDVKVLDIIDKKYFGKDHYTDWVKICWAIKYAWEDEAEDIAIKYSLHPDYTEQETEKAVQTILDRYVNKNITFGTLCYYAKESNPDAFEKWKIKNTMRFKNIKELAKQRIKDEFFNRILRCDGSVFYREKDQYKWICNEKEIRLLLYRYVVFHQERFIIGIEKCVKGEVEWVEKEVTSRKQTYELVDDMMEICPINNKFKNNLKSINKDRIWFNNGYYSFINDTFITPPFNVVMASTMVQIEREYEMIENMADIQEIYKRILNPIFSDRRDLIANFLYELKKVFNGNDKGKNWFSLVGERDCGKGVLCDLISYAFSYYCSTCSYSNFVIKKNDKSSSDFNWLLQKEFTRFLYVSEADYTKVWDGTQIKSICSGGDTLTTRKLFNDDETKIDPELSLFVFCNDYLKTEPADATKKLIGYDLKSVFINDGEDKPLSNIKYYKKDQSLRDEFCKSDNILMAFCHMVFNANPTPYPIMELSQNDEAVDIKDFIKRSFKYNELCTFTPTMCKDFIKDCNLTITNSKLRNLIVGVFPKIKMEKRHTSWFLIGVEQVEDDDMQ